MFETEVSLRLLCGNFQMLSILILQKSGIIGSMTDRKKEGET